MKKFDIKWVSMALFMFGGTVFALKLPFMKWGVPCFMVAHGINLYYFIVHHKSKPLILQNLYFLLLNAFGIYTWFIK